MTTTLTETVTCAGCGQEMGIDDDYCWGHEEDCPRHDDPELEIECTCDLNYHHECCPDCNPQDSTPVTPFYCGTQFMDWTTANCERCTKGAVNTVGPDDLPTCEIELALGTALFLDGTITPDIARRMNYYGNEIAHNWKCGEVTWTKEWKATVLARKAAEVDA